MSAQQIQEIGRADECRHDADTDLHPMQQDASQRITEHEEHRARKETRGQQPAMIGADEETHHVGHNEPHKADIAADTDSGCRCERGEHEKEQRGCL